MIQTTVYIALALALLSSCTENNNNAKPTTATSNPDSLAGKSTYVNPADGKTYTTDGEYKKYTPEDGVKKVSGPVQPLNVVLLTDQSAIPAIINIDKLADFIKGVDNVVIKDLATVKDSGQIILQFTLYAHKKPGLVLSYKGNFKNVQLNELSQKVDLYGKDIRTQKDSCIFQSVYGVNEKQ